MMDEQSDADSVFKNAGSCIADTSADEAARAQVLYHSLFELMPGSVVLLDAQGLVLDANPSFCRQIGYAREELLGQHVARFSKDSPETIECNLARLLAGEVLEHDVSNIHKDRSLRHYELRETAITLPDGSRGILVLSNDITRRVNAEKEKLELQRQFLHAEKLKSLGLMAGGIAHDFNNLLAAIIGNIELAMMDGGAKAADRVPLGELLGVTVSQKASVEYRLAKALPPIEGDAVQLQQIVMNLVTNASEALGDRPGLITLATGTQNCDAEFLAGSRTGNTLRPGRYVVLEVTDSGCGMDDVTQHRLFDPFFTTKFTGRGLGMSAVLGAVRGHNGGILVSSRTGHGTTISLLFPTGAPHIPSVTAPSSAAKAVETAQLPVLTGTVLVADDEAVMRTMVERLLKRTGLRVIQAANGIEAVKLFKQHAHEITFVLLDQTMPKLDGAKTLKELRRLRPDVKAVLTSGYNEASISQCSLQEGFVAFMPKPYQAAKLIELARQICTGEA